MPTTTQTIPESPPDIIAQHRTLYLKAMRQVPGAVAIIGCAQQDNRGGLAATAWTSVCADPPMMLACVNQSASAHGMFHATRGFSINLLAEDDLETVAIFSGQRGLSGSERFLAEHWETGETGLPVLNTAVASFECSLVESHAYGTHTVLIGRVNAIRSAPERAGLLYIDGAYAGALRKP